MSEAYPDLKFDPKPNIDLMSVDWTAHAGNVRYQGVCGACYTFATSDAVSALMSIYKYDFFLPLSTQQVVDCCKNGLTYGCSGGYLEGSFAYMQILGITTAFEYPFISARSGKANECVFKQFVDDHQLILPKHAPPPSSAQELLQKEVVTVSLPTPQKGQFSFMHSSYTFKIASFANIDQGNCRAIQEQLINYGPVSIGIAGYRLQFYKEGIFQDCNSYIDHAVVLIGYKLGVGWKIKNSWSTEWGMNGFGWIEQGNNCGICDNAVKLRL